MRLGVVRRFLGWRGEGGAFARRASCVAEELGMSDGREAEAFTGWLRRVDGVAGPSARAGRRAFAAARESVTAQEGDGRAGQSGCALHRGALGSRRLPSKRGIGRRDDGARMRRRQRCPVRSTKYA